MTGLTLLAAATIVASSTPAARAAELLDHAIQPAERTHVAVLGTAHLAGLPSTTDWRNFAPLIDKLAAWRPKVIAIESISGRQCDVMRRDAFRADDVKTYCFDPTVARTMLGIDGPAADAAITKLLATLKAERPPEERRRLAGLFLASGDPASAKVQWLRLPGAERHVDAHLPAALVALLERRAARHKEDDVIAVPLAVRLGLERIYPVDDQGAMPMQGSLSDEEYGAGLTRIWNNPWNAKRDADEKQWAPTRLTNGDAVLAWYRYMNSAKAAELAVRSDFAAAAADRAPGDVGRRYLAYWEIRNLRMVANLREAAGPTPGMRMLAIVGASHKGFYERYLGQMAEISVDDVDTILR